MNTPSLSSDYKKLKRLLMFKISNRIGPSDAEDVLHECFIRKHEVPLAGWTMLVREQCGQWINKRRRIDLGFDDARLSDVWAAARHIETRDLVRRATTRLTQKDIQVLLDEEPANGVFANRIRVARRVAQRALPDHKQVSRAGRAFRVGQTTYEVPT